MKKVVCILAVGLMTLSLFSCDKNSANNDDIYENVDISASDSNKSNSQNGSGGE